MVSLMELFQRETLQVCRAEIGEAAHPRGGGYPYRNKPGSVFAAEYCFTLHSGYKTGPSGPL